MRALTVGEDSQDPAALPIRRYISNRKLENRGENQLAQIQTGPGGISSAVVSYLALFWRGRSDTSAILLLGDLFGKP